MTLREVKRRLGRLAKGVSDDDLQEDLEVAQQLAEIYLRQLRSKSKIPTIGSNLPNVP